MGFIVSILCKTNNRNLTGAGGRRVDAVARDSRNPFDQVIGACFTVYRRI